MNSSKTSLAREVAKRLRYQTVNDLLDLDIDVPELSKLTDSAIESIGKRLSHLDIKGNLQEIQEYQERVFGKYGFADITFQVGSLKLEDVPLGDLALMESLGFVFHQDELDALGYTEVVSDDLDVSTGCLEDLRDCTAEEQLFLRVFCGKARTAAGASIGIGRRRTSAVSWPVRFTITDACLTNADGVWINRHFYV